MGLVDSDQSSGFLTSTRPSQATTTTTTPLGSASITSISQASAALPSRTGQDAVQTSIAAPSEQPSNDSTSAGLSSGAQKVVICTSTIGGTIILLLLLYALWRKRRGSSYSEIVRFRPQSETNMTQSDSSHKRLTALPIYRQERFSITSSRHSLPATPKLPRKMPFHGSSLRTEFRADTPEPLMPSRPEAAKTSKKSRSKGRHAFLRNATPLRPSTDRPERALIHSNEDLWHTTHYTHQKAPYKNREQTTEHSSTALHWRHMSSDSTLTISHLPTTSDSPDRWSWTNSQAPPTPRVAAGPRLSFPARSISSVRSVTSWSTFRSKAKKPDMLEPRMPSSPRPTIPQRQKSRTELLKNQAVKPVLAPPPDPSRHDATSKPNTRHGRDAWGSRSSIS